MASAMAVADCFSPLRRYPSDFSEVSANADDNMLADVCEELGATAFLSTAFSRPARRQKNRSLRHHTLLVHDMMPELFGWDSTVGYRAEKRRALDSATSVVAVSNATAHDVLHFHGASFAERGVKLMVAYNGVSESFSKPASARTLDSLKDKFPVTAGVGGFVMMVGYRMGYKHGWAMITRGTLPELD